MGYTHYWRRPTVIKNFSKFALDVKKLAKALPEDIKIVREYDSPKSKPEITSESVRFNGAGELGHETFSINKVFIPESWSSQNNGLWFDFCKTARKPYDLLVVASLLALQRHCPECEISSDGDAEDWKEGTKFFNKILGEK